MLSDELFALNGISEIKAMLVEGTEIELLETNDNNSGLHPGDKGIVRYVDDAGHIHMEWKNGSKLSLVPYADRFRIIK